VLVPEPDASPEEFVDWPPEGQRADTAPLVRDHSRVSAERNASPYPADATRPTFAQPGPTRRTSGQWSTPGFAGTIQQPAPSPTAVDTRPRRRITPMGWVTRGLVLVAISVVSGLIWYTVKHYYLPQNTASETTQGPPTKYPYTRLASAGAADCKSVSTGQVKEFFTRSECDHLTRQLYTTTLPSGQRVLVSVITVGMSGAPSAERLQSLAKGHDTGQVYALSHSQKQWPSLDDNVAYRAQRRNNVVVITDAGYFDRAQQPANDPTLNDISADATQLGWPPGTPSTN
jgi:hypothetical protein